MSAGTYTIPFDAYDITLITEAIKLPSSFAMGITLKLKSYGQIVPLTGSYADPNPCFKQYTFDGNTKAMAIWPIPLSFFQSNNSFSVEASCGGLENNNAPLKQCNFSGSYNATPPPITFLISSTPSGCPDNKGEIRFNAVYGGGGFGTYSYSISPSIQPNSTGCQTQFNIPSGTYTATVSSAGITASKTITVGGNPCGPLAVTATTQPANCTQPTGTATANPSGGTGYYIYSWNTIPIQTTQMATQLPTGTYTCTVTSGASTQTVNAVVGQFNCQPITINAPFVPDVNCNSNVGVSVTVNATGGNGNYTYSWNTNPVQTTQTATNLTVGTYICTVTSGSFTQTKTITIKYDCPEVTSRPSKT